MARNISVFYELVGEPYNSILQMGSIEKRTLYSGKWQGIALYSMNWLENLITLYYRWDFVVWTKDGWGSVVWTKEVVPAK